MNNDPVPPCSVRRSVGRHSIPLLRGRSFGLAACVLVFFALIPLSPAKENTPGKQKDYALIFGTVWNAAGRPVPGIMVKIRREGDNKPKWQLVSDGRGEFAQRLPAGKADYVVWADVKGPKGKAKAKTKVHLENDERVDIGLHLTE